MIFPRAFLDSSSCWNINHDQLQLQQIGSNTHITTAPSPAGPGDGGANNNNLEGLMAAARAGGGGGDGGGGSGGAGDGDGDGSRNSKLMSMSERARLARVPQPELGLNCPRCNSTNTKFCYFNNYSLTQPRHFCRACRRYWTRGGALHNVPVGGGYRRHAKRSAKPKAASTASGAGAGTSSATSMTPNTTGTTTSSPALLYSMFGSVPPQGRLIDSFDPASLGLSFPARLLFAEGGDYAVEGDVHHHQQGNENDMEQWAAQMQSFPFLHAMDHQMAGQLSVAMPTTMEGTQGMFHLGLQSGSMEQWAAAQMQSFPFLQAMDHQMVGPPAAAMPTTMAAMQDMFHLVLQSGGNGDDGGDHQFHHPLAKRDYQQQQQDYTSSRGIYGDVVNGNGGCGYNFYSSTSNAPGN